MTKIHKVMKVTVSEHCTQTHFRGRTLPGTLIDSFTVKER